VRKLLFRLGRKAGFSLARFGMTVVRAFGWWLRVA